MRSSFSLVPIGEEVRALGRGKHRPDRKFQAGTARVAGAPARAFVQGASHCRLRLHKGPVGQACLTFGRRFGYTAS